MKTLFKAISLKFLMLIFRTATLYFFTKSSFAQDAYPVRENQAGTHYLLGILGYNYSNRYIDSFSVNGSGGGNVDVSTPTAGGGSTACCVFFSKNPSWPIYVTVRWQAGGCTVGKNERGVSQIHHSFKEVKVNVERGTTSHPSDIGIHFFKDGSVKAILSDGWESPLLKLPEARQDTTDYPPCQNRD